MNSKFKFVPIVIPCCVPDPEDYTTLPRFMRVHDYSFGEKLKAVNFYYDSNGVYTGNKVFTSKNTFERGKISDNVSCIQRINPYDVVKTIRFFTDRNRTIGHDSFTQYGKHSKHNILLEPAPCISIRLNARENGEPRISTGFDRIYGVEKVTGKLFHVSSVETCPLLDIVPVYNNSQEFCYFETIWNWTYKI